MIMWSTLGSNEQSHFLRNLQKQPQKLSLPPEFLGTKKLIEVRYKSQQFWIIFKFRVLKQLDENHLKILSFWLWRKLRVFRDRWRILRVAVRLPQFRKMHRVRMRLRPSGLDPAALTFVWVRFGQAGLLIEHRNASCCHTEPKTSAS